MKVELTHVTDSTYAFVSLEIQLASYLSDKSGLSKPFDLKMVPVITKSQAAAQAKRMLTQCCPPHLTARSCPNGRL